MFEPLSKSIPVPELKNETVLEDRRLWIGNLDPRITEYHLLKIIQEYGEIEKLDLLFHKSGPHAGQPRGFAFVTYKNKDDAQLMKRVLDGKKMGSKWVSVKWAHCMEKTDMCKPKTESVIPALGVKREKKISTTSQIKAIESKLKMMEYRGDAELEIQPTVSSSFNDTSKRKITSSSNCSSKKPMTQRQTPGSKK